MAMHDKSFNVDIPPAVSQAFSEHVDQQGYTKWRAIMGAVKAYMALPADIQVFVNNPDTTVKQAKKVIAVSYTDKFRLKVLDTPPKRVPEIDAAFWGQVWEAIQGLRVASQTKPASRKGKAVKSR